MRVCDTLYTLFYYLAFQIHVKARQKIKKILGFCSARIFSKEKLNPFLKYDLLEIKKIIASEFKIFQDFYQYLYQTLNDIDTLFLFLFHRHFIEFASDYEYGF